MWVRSPLEEMKYLLKFIFLFLRSGVEAKRGVEFHHSLQKSAKSGERSVLTLGSLCLPCCVQDTAWNWLNFFFNDKLLFRMFHFFHKAKENLVSKLTYSDQIRSFFCYTKCNLKKSSATHFFLFFFIKYYTLLLQQYFFYYSPSTL